MIGENGNHLIYNDVIYSLEWKLELTNNMLIPHQRQSHLVLPGY